MRHYQRAVPVKHNVTFEAMKEFFSGIFGDSRLDRSATFAKSDALRSTGKIARVRTSIDKLKVSVPEPEIRSDDDIMHECEDALGTTLPGANHAINVMVSSGWVRLSGTVARGCERWTAEEIVSRVRGVNGVNGQIEVQH